MGAVQKTRGLRLTEEALETLSELIQSRFAERSASGTSGRRLTREVRAELMGVSIRTSDRILKREPVDRASLITVFHSVGAVWDEAWIEQPRLPSGDPRPIEFASNVEPGIRCRISTLLFGGAAVAVVAILLLLGLGLRPHDWRPEFVMEMEAATRLYHRAEYKDARTHLARAARIARPHRQADALAWVQRLEAEVDAAEGDMHKALERIELAVAYLKDLGVLDQYYGALELSANYMAAVGRFDEARARYLECLAYGKNDKDRYLAAAASRGLGELSLQERNFAEAVRWFDLGIEVLGPDFEAETSLDLRARKGLALAHLGRFADASEILDEALAYWEKKGHRRWIAASHYRLGKALRLKGDRVMADLHFARARAAFVSVGDSRGVERCDQALERRDGGQERIPGAESSSGMDELTTPGGRVSDPLPNRRGWTAGS